MVKETRAELALAMTDHALAKLADAEWQPLDFGPAHHFEIRRAQCGDFHVMHARPRGSSTYGEMLDVRYGGKLLAMRNCGAGWTLVSMKRGDWESGFLLT